MVFNRRATQPAGMDRPPYVAAVSRRARRKRVSTEVFSSPLGQPTALVGRGIFLRFLLITVGIYALVGSAMVAYDLVYYFRTTEEHLQNTAAVISRVALELRIASGRPDPEVVKEAARLTQAPMALVSRADGAIVYSTAPQIRDKTRLVYDGRPALGTRIVVEEELDWLSGAWTVSRFSDENDLLAIAIRRPEEEGMARYMTFDAGLVGLGLVLCFFAMLAAANWVLKRPLHQLVEEVTAALRDQLAFRNHLMDAPQAVGIVAADLDDRIQIFNRAAERILGYEAKAVEGRLTLEEFKEQRHGPPVERTQDRLPALVHPREGEEVWLDHDGREHLLDVSSSPILDTEGDLKGRLITFIDITERRRLEADLRQSELQLLQSAKMATLGEMATGVAHELNQPLNNIGLLASRLALRLGKAEIPEEERAFFAEKLDKVRRQVERASKIIDHLRAFGRPRGKRLGSVALAEPLRGVVDLLGEQLRSRGIAVDLELPSDLPEVVADEAQLEQVMMNLLVNARDALDALPGEDARERRVAIRVERSAFPKGQPAVCIHVADTGCGMSKEVQERIFDPFFSTKEVGKGTGLGLSISYGLVHGFGGALEVRSTEGAGSTFTIRLKTAAPATEPAASGAA